MSHKILSGSMIKLIAITAMAIDHTAHFLLYYQEALREPLFMFHNRTVTWYFLLRCVGRLAFPIFAFLIVEGFVHTSNRRRYGWSLLICALVSEIPWMLLHDFQLTSHNVMFTLLLGFLGMYVIEQYRHNWSKAGLILIGMFIVAFFFRADYGSSGFAFIIMLYALRRHLALQALVGCCMLPMKWVPGLAFIPISMYNGRRGFIRGTLAKYLFYAFYPLHLFFIWLIQQHLFF